MDSGASSPLSTLSPFESLPCELVMLIYAGLASYTQSISNLALSCKRFACLLHKFIVTNPKLMHRASKFYCERGFASRLRDLIITAGVRYRLTLIHDFDHYYVGNFGEVMDDLCVTCSYGRLEALQVLMEFPSLISTPRKGTEVIEALTQSDIDVQELLLKCYTGRNIKIDIEPHVILFWTFCYLKPEMIDMFLNYMQPTRMYSAYDYCMGGNQACVGGNQALFIHMFQHPKVRPLIDPIGNFSEMVHRNFYDVALIFANDPRFCVRKLEQTELTIVPLILRMASDGKIDLLRKFISDPYLTQNCTGRIPSAEELALCPRSFRKWWG